MLNEKNNTCIPTSNLLSQKQIDKIHNSSLEVLETVGVKVIHDEVVELLHASGCSVENKNIVKIPSSLVEDLLKTTPSRIDIFNRNKEKVMQLEGNNSYFGLGTDLINTYDLETGVIRDSLLKDVANAAIVSDHCQEIDFIASFALPHDVATNVMYIECFRAMVENSIKPIFFTAAGKKDLMTILEMAEAVAGGADELVKNPFLIHYSEPLAPLTHTEGALDKLLLCAERQIPICYIPTVLMGATGPVTIAGGVVQALAEALSSIVIHQLKAKGSPIISGWAMVHIDMRSSIVPYGAPEYRLTNMAYADILHSYKIPCWGIVGTDAHNLDQQAAMEHAFSIYVDALAGANLIHDVGYLGSGLLGNPAAIVMCDEIISYVKRVLRGFDITDDTLAVDLIRKIGPGGEFISDRHTLKHFRREVWRPKFTNRETYETWQKQGNQTYGAKVVQKAKDILSTHRPEPLPDEITTQLKVIVETASEELAQYTFPS